VYVYVAVSEFLSNTTKYQECFKAEAICFVVYSEAMDQDANRDLCAVSANNSLMPTLSNNTRLQAFERFLQDAQHVTNSQPVWLDIHRDSTPPPSGSLTHHNSIQ